MRFWIRLFIGRRKADLDFLLSTTSFTINDFAADFDSDTSNFNRHLNSVLDAIGMGRIRDNICDQDYNFLCSIHEIAMNQWLSSEFTLRIPPLFKNDYTEHFSWVEAFKLNEDNYLKSEIQFFVNIQPDFEKHAITLRDTFREFKSNRLFEPLYLMSFLRNNTGTDNPFDDDVFVSYLGIIYKNRKFPPLVKKYFIQDLLEESESKFLVDLQRRPLSQNGNPLVKTTYRTLPYPKMKGNKLSWQLLSGHMVEDFVRRVFTYNSTHLYATATKTFWHEDKYPKNSRLETSVYQPWRGKVHLSFGSDSIQYEPNIGQKTDIAYFSPMFRAHLDLDYNDIVSVFGIKTYDYRVHGHFFELSDPNDPNPKNLYHNYLYPDSFNGTEVFGASLFVTTPLYSTFGTDMRKNAALLRRGEKDVTFSHDDDTSINIEFYSGIPVKSRQAYQINYVFDTYYQGLDSFSFFIPSHIYTNNLVMNEEFAMYFFSTIRNMEQTRKLILIICFAVGGVLFALGISACIIIFIKTNKDDTIDEEDGKETPLKGKQVIN